MNIHLADRNNRPVCSRPDSHLSPYVTTRRLESVGCIRCNIMTRENLSR